MVDERNSPDWEIIILIGKLIQRIRRFVARGKETCRSDPGSPAAGIATSRRLDAQRDEREKRNPIFDPVQDRARSADLELRQAPAAEQAPGNAHVGAVRRGQ